MYIVHTYADNIAYVSTGMLLLTMFVVTKRRGRKKHSDFFHVGISEPEAQSSI